MRKFRFDKTYNVTV